MKGFEPSRARSPLAGCPSFCALNLSLVPAGFAWMPSHHESRSLQKASSGNIRVQAKPNLPLRNPAATIGDNNFNMESTWKVAGRQYKSCSVQSPSQSKPRKQSETQKATRESRNLRITEKKQSRKTAKQNRTKTFTEILRGFATRVLLQKVPIYGD